MLKTTDVNIRGLVPLIPPRVLQSELPITARSSNTVYSGRETIKRIMNGEDPRLLVAVGPCSIHDQRAALEYAARLNALAGRISDRIFVVMRVYFEKPRTTIGWKGLINDPFMDGTFDMATGLRKARELLLQINEMGLPAATEMLDPISPQYIADLITWGSIGARTTESQTHREMASGLSMPIGYKNATDGNLRIAFDAMISARNPHTFLGIDHDGRTCVVQTNGNPWGHLILRGGSKGPNYDAASIAQALEQLEAAGLPQAIMVDCSHANSSKDHRNQPAVFRDALTQRQAGNRHIVGMMVESNLFEGNQKIDPDPKKMKYGVSVTDACLGWKDTRQMLMDAYQLLGGEPLAEEAG